MKWRYCIEGGSQGYHQKFYFPVCFSEPGNVNSEWIYVGGRNVKTSVADAKVRADRHNGRPLEWVLDGGRWYGRG